MLEARGAAWGPVWAVDHVKFPPCFSTNRQPLQASREMHRRRNLPRKLGTRSLAAQPSVKNVPHQCIQEHKREGLTRRMGLTPAASARDLGDSRPGRVPPLAGVPLQPEAAAVTSQALPWVLVRQPGDWAHCCNHWQDQQPVARVTSLPGPLALPVAA